MKLSLAWNLPSSCLSLLGCSLPHPQAFPPPDFILMYRPQRARVQTPKHGLQRCREVSSMSTWDHAISMYAWKKIRPCLRDRFPKEGDPEMSPTPPFSLHPTTCMANSLCPCTHPGRGTSSQRLTKPFISMSFDSCLTTG